MASTTRKEIARGADVPLSIGGEPTRDALLDPRDGDIIPDHEEKGYHVGEVRQPAEPVLYAGGTVEFETIGSEPSKFTSTYTDQLDEIRAREAADPDLYAGTVSVPIYTDPEDVAKAKAEKSEAPARSARKESTAKDLDADAAGVARAQAAEDKKG